MGRAIEAYKTQDGTELAVIAATWEVHSKVTFESLAPEFARNPAQAWRNYGSRVTGAMADLAIKDPDLSLSHANTLRADPWDYRLDQLNPLLRGKRGTRYFIHFDLAKNKDRAGIAVAHLERTGVVVIDFMHAVAAKPGQNIDFDYLRGFVYLFNERGFAIEQVTYDQWQCLAGDTRINTDRGLIPLREVMPGDLVQSRTGPRKVLRRFDFGLCPTLRLRTSDGDVLEGTAEHRIEALQRWEMKDGRRTPVWEWRLLGALIPGDVVRMASAVDLDVKPPEGGPSRLSMWAPPLQSVYTHIEAITTSVAAVHDLEVEGDHSYVANGFISHNSEDSRQTLEKKGFKTAYVSADKTTGPYDTLIEMLLTTRVDYYVHPIFIREMKQLRTNGLKYDHPKAGSKDVADAVACATWSCINYELENPKDPPGKVTVIRQRGKNNRFTMRYERSAW